jgi:transposase
LRDAWGWCTPRPSVCIVDGAGKIIRETQVASEPEALVGYFSALEIKVVRIGLQACTLH